MLTQTKPQNPIEGKPLSRDLIALRVEQMETWAAELVALEQMLHDVTIAQACENLRDRYGITPSQFEQLRKHRITNPSLLLFETLLHAYTAELDRTARLMDRRAACATASFHVDTPRIRRAASIIRARLAPTLARSREIQAYHPVA